MRLATGARFAASACPRYGHACFAMEQRSGSRCHVNAGSLPPAHAGVTVRPSSEHQALHLRMAIRKDGKKTWDADTASHGENGFLTSMITTIAPTDARLPRHLARTTLHLACLAVMTGPAFAQADQTLPEVVVSAPPENGRLGQPPATGSNLAITRFETPASVDIISRRQLEERGDTHLNDAITRAPGITSMAHPGNGGASLVSRGFTDTVSVMRLYDGMRQYGGATVTFPFDTWSVDRIEVLRGPASVIYGEGAIGGVINVIPKKPAPGPVENEVQAAIGTQQTRRLAFGSGGAINDRLSYRLDLSGDRTDGWVDRGDMRNRTFSGAVQLDVSPRFNARLSTAYGRQNPMRYFGTPLVDGAQRDALREKNYNVQDSIIEYKDRWTDLSLNWMPNADATVRSRFYNLDSDRHWRNAEAYVYNRTTGRIDRSDNTEIFHDQSQTGNTTDATFKGNLFGLKNQVSVGFDVNSGTFQHTNNTYVGSSPSVDPFNPVPGFFSSPFPTIPRYSSKARQYAVFAEDRLMLNDRWSVLGGVRYDHADLKRRNLVAGTLAYDKTFAETGWRLGTVYEATPELAVYGQVSRAADPISSLFFLSPANANFDNATGRQVEVGVKQTFWNKKGEWTLAAYDIRKNNLLTRDLTNPSQSIQVGQRSSRGIEGTLSMPIAGGWRVDANASLLRARFDDFIESVGGVATSRAGNVPTDVPRRLANLWVNWDFLPAWTAGAGARYVGERYADNANSLRLPSYTTLDLSLRWKMARETTLSLRGYNVTDKHYFTTAYYTPTQWLVGASRRVELVMNHRF
jgi:iron complex outermembrane receptor protein